MVELLLPASPLYSSLHLGGPADYEARAVIDPSTGLVSQVIVTGGPLTVTMDVAMARAVEEALATAYSSK